MSKAVITKSLLTDIADAIRAKTGKSASMTPAAMADEIDSISGGGDVPAYLYSDTDYDWATNTKLIWPYSTMRICQFFTPSQRDGTVPFVQQFDAGALTIIPERAFGNGTMLVPDRTAVVHSLTAAYLDNVVELGDYAFNGCSRLFTCRAPKLRIIGASALQGTAIRTLPATVEEIKSNGIRNSNVGFSATSSSVTNLPALRVIGNYACMGTRIRNLIVPSIESIGAQAFQGLTSLRALVMDIGDSAALPTLANSNAFSGCLPTDTSSGGYIYITDSRVDALKAETNWAVYANRIRPLSEYVEE